MGIGFPYFPWDPDNKRRIGTVQLPLVLMDGALFYQGSETAKSVQLFMMDLIEKLKSFEGVGCIDWHVRTAYPGSEEYSEWGKAYLGILDVISRDPEIWVCNCREILDKATGSPRTEREV
jgi:hypothetical protein